MTGAEHPPTMELGGVRLRALRRSDAPALLAHLLEPAVTELTSYPEVSMELVESMIERSLSRWETGDVARWAIARMEDDRLVGTCGFNDSSLVHRSAELAYDLAPAEWGKGLMGKAASAVLDWTYARDQFDRVQALVRIDNTPSQRVLERAGFVREGCLRSYRRCRGKPYDFYVYAVLRRDWSGAT